MVTTMELCTDTEVRMDVLDELHGDPTVQSNDVGVEVVDGLVILTGTAPSYEVRVSAGSAALRVCGVHGIVNDIEVRLPSFYQRCETKQ